MEYEYIKTKKTIWMFHIMLILLSHSYFEQSSNKLLWFPQNMKYQPNTLFSHIRMIYFHDFHTNSTNS